MAVTDWLLTKRERDNEWTRLDDRHPGEQAWSEGNAVLPLIDGSAYFRHLYEQIEATGDGDLVWFTDWQGNGDERLTGEPGSEVFDVLKRATERGVDVRGLIWRSHWDKLGFFAKANRSLGESLQDEGAEVLLDMRVRAGGAHHQKFVVIRHRDDAARDVAYVGGIDLAHSRRDDHRHYGDPQSDDMADEYGDTPPWHDVQVAITGPAVHDVETVFRERWEDPKPLSRHPWHWLEDRVRGIDRTASPLPAQQPAPPRAGAHVVQLLRTYPRLNLGRDYPYASGGERSVANGYSKATRRSQDLIYVEDQYLWGHDVASSLATALRANPDLHVIAVLPHDPDLDGYFSRMPQLLGRERAIRDLIELAPDRVAVYGIENDHGKPIYVHAKVCVMDDTWASIGSDNFNRRSWTHDSELSVVVMEPGEGTDRSAYAHRLRLRLAAEHLGRLTDELAVRWADLAEDELRMLMADCADGTSMFAAYAESARRLDEWYEGGKHGTRPPGRLRRLHVPRLSRVQKTWAGWALEHLHDPDGRPRALRRTRRF